MFNGRRIDDLALRVGEFNPPALICLTIQGIIDIILDKHSSSCGYLANFLSLRYAGAFFKNRQYCPHQCQNLHIVGTDQQKILATYHILPVEIGDSHRLLRFGMEKLQRELWTSSLSQFKKEQSRHPQRVLPGAL